MAPTQNTPDSPLGARIGAEQYGGLLRTDGFRVPDIRHLYGCSSELLASHV
jgi:hypothetical protein